MPQRLIRDSTPEPPSRQFNTSRALKAVGDTATVDFAYFPKLFAPEFNPEPAAIRVPILPDVHSDDAEAVFEKYPELDAAAGGYQDTEPGSVLMRAQISAIDSTTASPMSDVHDGHHDTEMSVDVLTNLTDTVCAFFSVGVSCFDLMLISLAGQQERAATCGQSEGTGNYAAGLEWLLG